MDSVTQAVLGAAVVEATAGKQLGNRALLWGLVLGTVPDLDILCYPWLDVFERLSWHRGLSHSLLLIGLTSPLWGTLITWIHRRRICWSRATWAALWALTTHVLIDVFTVYGTQILEPFSNLRVATNNLFIIDPLFTLPLLGSVLAVVWLKADDARRRRWNAWGLALATVYAAWSFAAKGVVHQRVTTSLAREGIPYTRLMTAPTPFNTLLWRALVEIEDGLLVAYTSVLDTPGTPLRWERLPRTEDALAAAVGSRALEQLEWFSMGYWTAEPHPDGPLFFDWRFGEIRHPGPLGPDNPPRPIFAWQLRQQENGDWTAVPVRWARASRAATWPLIWRRLRGESVL